MLEHVNFDETLILGLVITQLDYANALYIGLPECDLQELQRMQNIAAKVVLNDGDNSYNSLKRLHWLPKVYMVKHPNTSKTFFKYRLHEELGFIQETMVSVSLSLLPDVRHSQRGLSVLLGLNGGMSCLLESNKPQMQRLLNIL